MPTDLTPGTITTLGALRPGDVGVFVRDESENGASESEPFVVVFCDPYWGVYCQRPRLVEQWRSPNPSVHSVRYLGRGRIEPARIVMEGEDGAT